MLLERKVVNVPAQREIDADWSEYGQMGVKTRGAFGAAAIDAGTPDSGMNGEGWEGERTDALDTIANVLHHLRYGHADDATDDALHELFASAFRAFREEVPE